MSGATLAAREAETTSSRHPRQLLLALLGELEKIDHVGPLRTGFFLDVLEGAGVAGPTARAGVDRLVLRGMLSRRRAGREVEYEMTEQARDVLREAAERVHSPHPFAPQGRGWTLVTFTLPEEQRALRQRLRAALTWEGFAPLRDGLWLAPGEVDLAAALGPLRDELPPHCLVAFRARDLDEFPAAPSARGAWDLAGIRAQHEAFLTVWSQPPAPADAPLAPLSALTALVADWLALLRADPRLPREFLDEDWPADRSIEVYRRRRAELAAPALAAFAALTGA